MPRTNDVTRCVRGSALIAALALGGCLEESGPRGLPSVGSESHFLSVCATDRDCDAPLSCVCGTCTVRCVSDAICTWLDLGAQCGFGGGPTCPTAGDDEVCVVECAGHAACAPGGTCVDGLCQRPANGPLDTPDDEEPLPVIVIPCVGPDGDGDGWPDACDPCPALAAASCPQARDDHDGDGVQDVDDDDDDDDGLSDADELLGGTDPLDADTDDDGLSDGVERAAFRTDPVDLDTDQDGVQDGTESGVTTPLADTSLATFMPDADPTTTTDPRVQDTDDDLLMDGEEDTNGNGRVDPGESDPLAIHDGLQDGDADGLTDRDERMAYGTDPMSADTDVDGLDDRLEVQVFGTDPRRADSDGDGESDGAEVDCGANPLVASDLGCDGVECRSSCECYGLRGLAVPDMSCEVSAVWRCDGGACVADCGGHLCGDCAECWDPDGDGLHSFHEALCGTNPVDPASVPPAGANAACVVGAQ